VSDVLNMLWEECKD